MWFFVDEDVHIKDTIGALTKWTKDYGKKETHEILGGVFGGELLDAKGVDAVGKLPTKQELMGRLAFALQEAGAARIVRCINQARLAETVRWLQLLGRIYTWITLRLDSFFRAQL